MPILTLNDFNEATEFEQYALELLLPAPASTESMTMVIDLQFDPILVSVAVSESILVTASIGPPAHRVAASDELRPLAVGVAWKILDLMVELSVAGQTPDLGTRWSIGRKTTLAASGQCAPLPPFDHDHGAWDALLAAYAEVDEIRHSIVHRRIAVDPTAQQITGHGSTQRALRSMSFAEQEAFGFSAMRAADAVVHGSMSKREHSDLRWHLDQLAGLHGGAMLGGVRLRQPGTIVVGAAADGDEWLVDMRATREVALPIRPDNPLYDIAIHSPEADGRILLGPLEGAPEGELRINPASPPDWLSRGTS